MKAKITVLNPAGFPPKVTRKELAPRLPTLEGKTVGNMLRGMDPHTPPTLLLDPITARQFIDRGGFLKMDALIDWLYATARMPADEYWDYQLVQNYIYPRATFGEEPWASKLKAAPDELIPMFRREDIHVVVVGGETNGYWRIMGCTYQKTVSVDEWR